MIYSVNFIILLGLFFRMEGVVSSNGCNPLYCFNIFDSLFLSDQNTSCSKSSKLLECARKCSKNSSENYIIKGLESLSNSLCSDFYIEDSANVNKCIFRQRFSIILCIQSYSNLEAENPLTDRRLLNCKKTLDVGSCSTMTVPCTARATHVSEGLLSSLFNSFLDECHDFDTMDIAYLEVKPLKTKNSSLLASCLDENSHLITQCLSKWTDFEHDSCRSTKLFVNCMQVLVHNKCSNLENTFMELSQIFLSNINFYSNCSGNSKLNVKQSTKISNESTNIFSGDQKIKIISTISSAPLNKIAEEKNTPDKTPKNNNEFKTLDAIHQTTNNTRDLHFKQSFDENEATELHSQISNSPEAKSSNEPSELHPKEKEYHTEITRTQDEILETNSPSSSNAPPNSSNPIIIHKTTYITLTYRAKNGGNCVSAVIMLIGMILLSLFLQSKFL